MFALAGLNLVENYPYEAIEKGYDFVRLASITAGKMIHFIQYGDLQPFKTKIESNMKMLFNKKTFL